jgi:COP9 signalosome complex subunit 5
MDSSLAQRTFEAANAIEAVAAVESLYQYDTKQQQEILNTKPWTKDPHYFKKIRISALALLKMVRILCYVANIPG